MAVNDPSGGAEPGRQETFDRAYVESLRAENAQRRIRERALEEKVKDQLAKSGDSTATIRRLSIDNHLLSKGTVDPKLIRFYLSEENQLDDLDVSAEDWTTLLDDRVNDLLGRHPELKQQRHTLPVRSGTGGPTGGPGQPSTQLSRADAQMMSPEQVAAAFQSGHFDHLLGRRR